MIITTFLAEMDIQSSKFFFFFIYTAIASPEALCWVLEKQTFLSSLNTENMLTYRECSGSVVEYLTRDRGAAGLSLTGFTTLWSLSMNINPSLVLVQPRKTCPFVTERLLTGRKESNQTKHAGILEQLLTGMQTHCYSDDIF